MRRTKSLGEYTTGRTNIYIYPYSISNTNELDIDMFSLLES